ncbi:MAG TPA: cob(I)yrinic acid a,c-diamide adenosyltransferase [Terracidiphilus sp.]|nr:cob(I)yrinic acid a,c-diamide adenosyltransferase [Terracidiphilus sp.]
MSIATKHGDGGQTGLAGGVRVSKADLRVEAYGTVDELNAHLGFARSICGHTQIAAWTEEIQRMLFRVGGALATPAERRKGEPLLTNADVDNLTAIVEQLESREGILADWSLPGWHTGSAAYEVARTVCRRAERCVVRFVENRGDAPAEVVAYLNRLSDVIWLFSRTIELDAGVNSRLRGEDKAGPNFSRAW